MGARCSDALMAAFIMIFKNIMTVFQVIVPILLIASAIISVGKMVFSPDVFDEKDPHGKRPDRVVTRVLLHKVASAVIIFFLPYMINMTISTVVKISGDSFSFNECWNAASNGQGVIQWVPGGQDTQTTPNEDDATKANANKEN